MSTFVAGGNVSANGIRQHYLRYGGKGHALILVPGITSPAITWGFVAERLGRYFDTMCWMCAGALVFKRPGPGLRYTQLAADVPSQRWAWMATTWSAIDGARRHRAAAQGHRDCSGWCWSTHRCPGQTPPAEQVAVVRRFDPPSHGCWRERR
jgi:N-formylmaleamate deformylase